MCLFKRFLRSPTGSLKQTHLSFRCACFVPLLCTRISKGGGPTCSVCTEGSPHTHGLCSLRLGIQRHHKPTGHESTGGLSKSNTISGIKSTSHRAGVLGRFRWLVSRTWRWHSSTCLVQALSQMGHPSGPGEYPQAPHPMRCGSGDRPSLSWTYSTCGPGSLSQAKEGK